MLDYIHAKKKKSDIAGMGQVKFHGEVLASNFVNHTTLQTVAQVYGGYEYAANNNVSWLHFSMDNKVLYIPKKSFRFGCSWRDIYDAGCVYGMDSNGPSGVSYDSLTPRNQGKKITIGGKQYRIRLLKGSNANPCPDVTGSQYSHTGNSEWDRLFYSVAATRPASNIYTGPIFASYSDADLGFNDRNAGEGEAGYSWCQEQHAYHIHYRVCRGFYNAQTLYREAFYLNNDGWGWRPVLELIP